MTARPPQRRRRRVVVETTPGPARSTHRTGPPPRAPARRGKQDCLGIDSSQQAYRQQPRHGSIRLRAGAHVAEAPRHFGVICPGTSRCAGVEAGDQVGELIPGTRTSSSLRSSPPDCGPPCAFVGHVTFKVSSAKQCRLGRRGRRSLPAAGRAPVVSACSTSSASNTASRRSRARRVAARPHRRAWARAPARRCCRVKALGKVGLQLQTAGSAVHRAHSQGPQRISACSVIADQRRPDQPCGVGGCTCQEWFRG